MKHITAEDLARELGGRVHGDGRMLLGGVASLEQAGPEDVVFADSGRNLTLALGSRAGCIIAAEDADLGSAGGRTCIVVAEPKRAFARAIHVLHPDPREAPGVHPSAVVDPSATLAEGVHVGPHATVEAGAILGAGVVIGPGSVVGRGARIGAGSTLKPRVVVYPGTVIGERVLVHAGAVLGSDGFGFVPTGDGTLEKFPQIGRLVIEDDVEIGANTAIDRGALGATVIGRGTKVDNLVQVAHNVTVGPNCAVSAQVGIAGSSVIEEGVTLAGQVGIADHVRVEKRAVVGAQAGVPSKKIIREGQIVWGTPARPLHEFKRQHAHLSYVAELRDRVRALEARFEKLLADGGAGAAADAAADADPAAKTRD